LIDPWKFLPEYPTRWYGGRLASSQTDMDSIYESVQEEFGSLADVTIHRMTSSESAGHLLDGSLDWIYVDGNHSYDFVEQDLQLFLPKMKAHGFMAGDDYVPEPDGGNSVRRAVDDFVARTSGCRLEIIESQFVISLPDRAQ